LALLGQHSAIIPIGLSYQTAWQVHHHRDFLSFLLDEDFEILPSFLERPISSADQLPTLLRRIADGPIETASWDVPAAANSAVMLKPFKLWLWYEKASHQVEDDDLAAIAAKFEQRRLNLLRLAEMPRRVFVVGSGQNDLLNEFPYLRGGLQLGFTDDLVAQLRETLDALFPHGENHLLIVGKPRWIGEVVGAYALPEEQTYWHGVEADWRHVLFAFLTDSFPELQAETPRGAMVRVIGDLMQQVERERWRQSPAEREGGVDGAELERRLTRAMRERDALAHRAAALETQLAPLRAVQSALRLEPLRRMFRR
jgi:hypothetical protein